MRCCGEQWALRRSTGPTTDHDRPVFRIVPNPMSVLPAIMSNPSYWALFIDNMAILGYSTSTYCSAFWCNLRSRVFVYFRCLTASIQGRGKEGKGEGSWERWKGTIIGTFPPPLPFYMPVTQATSPPNIFSGVFPDIYFKPIHILCNDYFGNFWNSLGGTSWSFHTMLFHQKISIISYQQILL